jgi:6-phosphogluconolactonase
MNRKKLFMFLTMLLALTPMTAFGAGRQDKGAVYAMTNNPDSNAVVAFARDFRGRLTRTHTYMTGGLGSGGKSVDPLGSQGSLILSRSQRWLFAANAGSNDISVFRVHHNGLRLVNAYDSGGSFPVSLAFFHNLLYVLNAGQDGDGPNITGFKLNRRGDLTPLAGSTRSLGAGGFHQLGFNPSGDALVVTQGDPKGVNNILVFGIDEDGIPAPAPIATASNGLVPFGFVFDWLGHLLVSEAGSGAVSSYAIKEDHSLATISQSVSNGNAATCWIARNWYGAVFTSNTGSDNLSAYRDRVADGSLNLVDDVAASGNKPIDMAIPITGENLYVLNAGDGTVSAFRILFDGELKPIGTVAGLPPTYAQGIAVK